MQVEEAWAYRESAGLGDEGRLPRPRIRVKQDFNRDICSPRVNAVSSGEMGRRSRRSAAVAYPEKRATPPTRNGFLVHW